MRRFTHVQAIVIQQLQPRGAWLKIGPGTRGGQQAILMRSQTEEVEVIDIRVFRSLAKLGVIHKIGTIQAEAQRHARQRFVLKQEYRNAKDHD